MNQRYNRMKKWSGMKGLEKTKQRLLVLVLGLSAGMLVTGFTGMGVTDVSADTSAGAGLAITNSSSSSSSSSTTAATNTTGSGQSSSGTGSASTGQSGQSGESDTDDSDKTLQEVKEEAKKEITGYAAVKKVGVSEEVAAQIDKLVKKYNKTIGNANEDTNKDGLATASTVKACVTTAKEAIDELVPDKDSDSDSSAGSGSDADNNQPSSTSDFIMVGGDWVTPEVSYGQTVNIVLPVVNMSQINLTNVTVTPVLSNAVNEWPFELETSNYTQTIPDLPGSGNGQNDMDRRRELTWTLKAREDALSGYYKLQFTVLYSNGSEIETATLTTYVKVNGAPGAGNVENDGGSLSTPRVIVTGFETNPAKVHAGDTFTLTLHLKNTSKRTAVSNMLVNLTAPNEGTDSDNSYAAFLPTSGSNSEYIPYIGKGQTTDLVIEMSAKADLSQKPYQLDVSMDYEDEDYASHTATADVSIPVIQEARFELSKPEIMPAEVTVGSDANVMFSLYNLGRVTLYNVKVSFEGESISGGDSYLGKVEAGGTGNVDVMVTGVKETEEGETDNIVITYEDEAGNKSEYKQEIDLKVKADTMENGDFGEGGLEGFPEEFDGEELEYSEGGAKKWIIIGLIALAVIGAITGAVIGIKKAHQKKQEKEDLSLLDELSGKEEEDEIP